MIKRMYVYEYTNLFFMFLGDLLVSVCSKSIYEKVES